MNPRTNVLASEASAYLRSAAHQPVHWHAWGKAAFDRARAEDKPILLDIGAVWCHWCHVMDGESYDDPAVAEVLNQSFVCVKVDRDERPDVDLRYQRAVQALSGQGGWPLTAFLTPDGEVFFGGTYFPPADNPYGRPGFVSVLRQVARAYQVDRTRIVGSAKAISEHVRETLDESKSGEVGPGVVTHVADQMARLFDIRFGGFGTAPKFPHPQALQFLLARWHDERADWMRDAVEKTLTGMARGGIRDQLGGGFHRYSVDERWIVPHFEKMAYDNAALLHAYLDGYAAFGTPLYREVASGIVDWVLEVLSDRHSTFYTSQDADVSPGDDGDYWTWTLEEARAALDERELAVVRRVFDLDDVGEMHHNPQKNVLWREHDAAPEEVPLLAPAMRKLKAARDQRQRPYVDTTSYVNWSAMLGSAFLHAGAVLDRPECNTLALAALNRIWSEAWDEAKGLSHVLDRPEPSGILDDNVQAAAAFLDAFEATGDAQWLTRTIAVMRYCERVHWDEKGGGGFFDTVARGGESAYLANPAKLVQDAPTPSPNGVAALVLARLAALTDDAEWGRRLRDLLGAFGGTLPQLSLYGATLARALDWAVHPVTRIEVSGPPGEGPACAMHLVALQHYRPRKAVLRKLAPAASSVVCVGTSCSLPVTTPAALTQQLSSTLVSYSGGT